MFLSFMLARSFIIKGTGQSHRWFLAGSHLSVLILDACLSEYRRDATDVFLKPQGHCLDAAFPDHCFHFGWFCSELIFTQCMGFAVLVYWIALHCEICCRCSEHRSVVTVHFSCCVWMYLTSYYRFAAFDVLQTGIFLH